jgi:hypothetical protein
MTGKDAGYAVWPSGVRWIVLGTKDGWRKATNRTPVAVPTDGGLVLAAAAGRVALGVLPFQQLMVSPVLTSGGSTRLWAPSQLPSALAPSSTALARTQGATWAVLADGSLRAAADGSSSWTAVTSAQQLDPSHAATLTGVSFPGGATGFLTAAHSSAGPSLFVTTDAGRTWRDSGLSVAGTSVMPWPPCRIGSTWVTPVQVDDRLEVFTAARASGPWTQGPSIPSAGSALVTCTPERVIASVPSDGTELFFAAAPGGNWTAAGSLDRPLVTMTAVSDTTAFAADADPSRVLEVSLGTPVRVAELPLPTWVGTLGGAAMRN